MHFEYIFLQLSFYAKSTDTIHNHQLYHKLSQYDTESIIGIISFNTSSNEIHNIQILFLILAKFVKTYRIDAIIYMTI